MKDGTTVGSIQSDAALYGQSCAPLVCSVGVKETGLRLEFGFSPYWVLVWNSQCEFEI